jgi:uracil-DNA glycosylase
MDINIESTWKTVLAPEFSKDYFKQLTASVKADYLLNDPPVYPPAELIFNAFNCCPYHSVRVVIIGQDPYHNPHQSHGLSFSVPDGVKLPPSLQNIYKEINHDLGKERPRSGNLERWAKQGVLLLNATLTVLENKPGSHQGKGWEEFTDAVIRTISQDKQNVVFLLWGNYARSKAALIDGSTHLILEAPHPSPLSARTGFFGCKHFSQANTYLTAHGYTPIDW